MSEYTAEILDVEIQRRLLKKTTLILERLDALETRLVERDKNLGFDTDHWSFCHAVCIVDGQSRHYLRSPEIEQLAHDLLIEYGKARGGEVLDFAVESWNYGRNTGYAMFFRWLPKDPITETRLKQQPTMRDGTLRCREELFVLPADQCQICGAAAIMIWSGDHSRRCREHLTEEGALALKKYDLEAPR